MKIVFCGNPDFAVPTLHALLKSPHEIVAVVTSPDKPRGRGKKLEPLPVKQHALEAGLPVLQPVLLKDPEFLETIRALQPDCLVVAAFRILPRELLALPPLGALNVHPSLLPKGRGPAPIQWTLINGETETGVSIIRLTEKIDAGGILKQERTRIDPGENFGLLHDRLALLGADLLLRVLEEITQNRTPAIIQQDESLVTKAPKLFAPDFVIDWNDTAIRICNRIRALSPAPGAVTAISGGRLKLLAAELSTAQANLTAGEIQFTSDSLLVGTGDGILRLTTVQPEGRRAMAIADYLRGRPALPTHFGG